MSIHILTLTIILLSSLTFTYTKSAYCLLNPDLNSEVSGYVHFSQDNITSPTTIVAYVTNLPPETKHGFHIHTNANFTQGCISTGPHYNPYSYAHGSPYEDIRHVGDMGNIQADDNGIADLNYVDPVISLFGNYSVIGRACVVHDKEDDLGMGNAPDSLTTGNAGARIACGAIVEGELEITPQEEESSSTGAFILRVVLLGGVAAGFYYFFIHKRKQRYQDFP